VTSALLLHWLLTHWLVTGSTLVATGYGVPRCLRAAALFLTSRAINKDEDNIRRRDQLAALKILAGDAKPSLRRSGPTRNR